VGSCRNWGAGLGQVSHPNGASPDRPIGPDNTGQWAFERRRGRALSRAKIRAPERFEHLVSYSGVGPDAEGAHFAVNFSLFAMFSPTPS
jgi:hypothetical protein